MPAFTFMLRLKRLIRSPATFVALVALALALPPVLDSSAFGSDAARRCAWEAPPAPVPPLPAAPAHSPAGQHALRVALYNLHSGMGAGGALFVSAETARTNLRGIARAIAGAADRDGPPDVVGLNEVDFAARRSGGFDQAAFVAAELRRLTGYTFEVVRGQTWQRDFPGLEARFGNAVLVRHPVLARQVCTFDAPQACTPGLQAGKAPSPARRGLLGSLLSEPRGLIRLTIDVAGRPADVLVTHLDAFSLAEREAQAALVVRRFADPARTAVLMGDINAVPTALTAGRLAFAADRTHDILLSGPLADARIGFAGEGGWSRWATYPARTPRWPLDAILATPDLRPVDLQVIGAGQSDHRGLYARFAFREPAAAAQARARHDDWRRRRLGRIVACDLQGTDRERRQKALALLTATRFLEIASDAQRRLLVALLRST